MKLQIKPNPWSCMLAASAMAMGISCSELERLIGHDGGLLIDDTVPEPSGRRGFHPQEIINAAIQSGWSVTQFQRIPVGEVANARIKYADFTDRMIHLIKTTRGVLIGHGHAAAYEKGIVYESDSGWVYDFSFQACEAHNFFPKEILIYERQRIL